MRFRLLKMTSHRVREPGMTNPDILRGHGLLADKRMAVTLGIVLLTGLVVRSLITLFPPLVTGYDGAYYLVQVRALLRNGTLAFPDFPLLFYSQALSAKFFTLFMEQHAAVNAAVRLTDTLLPLLFAVPVFLFTRAFLSPGDGKVRGTVAMALMGLLALVSGSTLLMAGGMIKNSVALPFGFFYAYSCCKCLQDNRFRSLLQAALWFILACLTHMSGFILTVVFTAGILTAGFASRTIRPRIWLPSVILFSCLSGCLTIVYLLDPVRAVRLIHAAINPGWLFEGSPVLLWFKDFPKGNILAHFDSAGIWLGFVLGVLGIFVLWRHYAKMDPPIRAILTVSTIIALLFSLPLFRPDVNERLALIAYVPGMIPAIYLLCRGTTAVCFLAPLTLLAMLEGALAVKTLRQTALSPVAYKELVQFKTALPQGQNIVIVQPLLRWWVAWTLDTHFSTKAGYVLAPDNKYDAVLLLDEIRSGALGKTPGPPGIGSPGAGVKDAELLRPLEISPLAEGTFFRLSKVNISGSACNAFWLFNIHFFYQR